MQDGRRRPRPGDRPARRGLGASVLPLALAGVAAGAVVTLLGLRGVRAVAALVGAAALVGVVAAALAHSWLGVLTGDWWAEAGDARADEPRRQRGRGRTRRPARARAGIGLGGTAGGAARQPVLRAPPAPRSCCPSPVGTIGQWLPPGAGASLLRSVSFFDGAAAPGPVLTLTWWAALGLGAVILGQRARSADAGERRTDAGRHRA